ncbi:MAG: SurA N-terminal domain-containing protein [Novosphingobium sp.]|nr:SurA N-terminal domain-containing protein [Novosphingobium sp.]
MLDFLRRHMKSTLGVTITLALLILIALAFAASDIGSSGRFGGVAGGDRVATVGNKRIDTATLRQAVTSSFDKIHQQQPQLTMKDFIAGGGLDGVLDQMIDRVAIAAWGEKHGIVAGDKLIDSEIASMPQFMGLDGKFNEAAYRQMLQQHGLSDQAVRQDLGEGLVAKQVLVPAAFGAMMPREVLTRYATLLKEHRTGTIALLPSAAFAPKTEPSDAEIAAFYARHRGQYVRPERRVIRYLTFDASALKNVPAPTDAEIAARYNANAAQYAATEDRKITQLIVPTEAAARAILDEVKHGTSLEAAAKAKGLGTTTLDAITRPALAGQSSTAVADAAFSAAKGTIAGPARSPLGWHLLRIDAVVQKPARSLAQAHDEIAQQLNAAKQRTALADFTAKLEDQLENGGTISDVAKQLGATPQQTPPLTADGKVFGDPTKTAPPELARAVPAAFAMERENQPQLAEIDPGKKFLVFDVTQITPAAPAPLAEIKQQVAAEVLIGKGATAARLAADKVLAAARKGADLGTAMAGFGVSLPPVDRVDMDRLKLTQQAQQVPPPLALLFSMAKGTVKLLPAQANRGFYVVAVKDIVPGQVTPNDPLLASARQELGSVTGREYADELARAVRAEVGVKRNEAGIRAVVSQLTGGGG